MTDVNKMLVTDDGIRVSPEDAEKFGLKTEGEVKLRSTGDRPKTTTALGRGAAKDEGKSGVLSTAAASAPGYEDNPSAGAPDDTAAADKDKGDGTTAADQDQRSGDDNGNGGDQSKNRARRSAGH